MHRNKSISLDHFAMVPRADIPRSSFKMESTHKSTFDGGYLVPVYVDEVLPGDTFNLSGTFFTRMATPIYPLMDNLHLDTFWFFVPNRIIWDNWVRFMGETTPTPSSSIDFTVPTITSPASGFPVGSIFDYMGLPTVGGLQAAATFTVQALALRAYNKIWNDWFRDENLQDKVTENVSDSDVQTNYGLLRRGKRPDYFTTALPWVQKGTAVTLPLGTSAPVKTSATQQMTGAQTSMSVRAATTGATPPVNVLGVDSSGNAAYGSGAFTATLPIYPSNLYADLSTATAATINQLRQSFQIQKLLERDARGGTRYTEILRSHFGVVSQDARLQRPEYLGGGSTPINISEIAQTSGTGQTGQTTPLGTLSAFARGVTRTGFTQSFTEHGIILGLVSVRADLTYQQGVRKMWKRSTRYDYYFPVFAHLGEQPVYNYEIYAKGIAADDLVFGYQERWSEYRYHPSRISGLFRSTSAGTLDGWHAAQNFTALPTLNTTFITDTPPLSRILAVGAAANGAQFLFDSVFSSTIARALPAYSVPGMVDHF